MKIHRLLPAAALLFSILRAGAADPIISHEFHGSGTNAVLRGGAGKFNGLKITFSDQPEPNRYFLYYQSKQPYELSITDAASGDLVADSALLVKREAGGPVDFGGLAISFAVPDWTPGAVTTQNLDSLRLEITLAARAGLKTPIFLEASNLAGKFLLRTTLPVDIVNNGTFHAYSYSLLMLPEAEKSRLVKALNKAESTNLSLNFPLTFSADAAGPAPFLAIKKLELLRE